MTDAIEYLQQQLIDAGLEKIVTLRLDKSFEWEVGYIPTQQEIDLAHSIIDPFDFDTYVDVDEVDFKTEYQNRIDRLTQIATVAKPDPFTQADIGAIFDALQDMARNQRAIIKRIKDR